MLSALILATYTWLDPRDIHNGVPMLAAGYTDQPYCAVSPNDRWVCVITASMGGEGSAGEQVYSVTSDDRGKTWSAPVVVENGTAVPGGLPNAYANIIVAPKLNGGKGRFYTVFNLNLDNVSMSGRDDELGYFYMRYSDDAGGSWSKGRYLVPYPNTWVDRQNDFKGEHHIMWTVDHIKVLADGTTAAFAFTKIGRYVQNPPEEVFFMASHNLLSEPDAAAVKWSLLPVGADHGVRAPAMYDPNTTVMEEGHLLPLSRGGCVAMARTDKGFLAAAKTNDSSAAAGWAPTGLARYWDPRRADGLVALDDIALPKANATYRTALKSERGPFTPKLHPSGSWLLLFYDSMNGRDPYFLSAGVEDDDGNVLWAQPEIAMYDPRYHGGTSAGGYPDFIFSGGSDGDTYITAAQKGALDANRSTAYVHQVDGYLLGLLLSQRTRAAPPEPDRLAADWAGYDAGRSLPVAQHWPSLATQTEAGDGFSIVLELPAGEGLPAGMPMIRSGSLTMQVAASGATLELTLVASNSSSSSPPSAAGPAAGGGVVNSTHVLDAACAGLLLLGGAAGYTDGDGGGDGGDGEEIEDKDSENGSRLMAVVVDAGAQLVRWFVDGLMCDGGGLASAGWQWTAPDMGQLQGGETLDLTSDCFQFGGQLYMRALYASELVGLHRMHRMRATKTAAAAAKTTAAPAATIAAKTTTTTTNTMATTAATTAAPSPPWPAPDPTLRPIFHVPADNSVGGYIGDANGMMFRRHPWNATTTKGGVFHLFWQAFLPPNGADGLYWSHAVSADYVFWATMPNPSIGPGAESGGAAQLVDGDVVAIFNRIGGGGGHWAARPLSSREDLLLTNWSITAAVPGIAGTDLNGGFRDGSGDGTWKIVADIPVGTAVPYADIGLFSSSDGMRSFSAEGARLHRYKWRRCVDLPTQCGFHTSPCDPGLFRLPGTDVWVLYGMQKTCSDSGREFYALGRYDNGSFTLLDDRSDMGNNVFDGGEGYAHMNVLDPRGGDAAGGGEVGGGGGDGSGGGGEGRMLWTGAVIEGDRDPSDPTSGFPFAWTAARGWFGVLTLPRVLTLGNVTLDDGSFDYFLRTGPLPELSALRQQPHGGAGAAAVAAAAERRVRLDGTRASWASPRALPVRGRSVEVNASFALPPASADGSGWDVGVQLLWSDGDEEATRVGVRDGSWMEKIDLWDEVNGDYGAANATDAKGCAARCAADDGCGAWTFTALYAAGSGGGWCRLKAQAQRSLLVVGGSPGCFLPSHGNWSNATSTSGFKQQRGVRFAQLYIDRTRSSVVGADGGDRSHGTRRSGDCGRRDCAFGHFGYAQTLRIVPSEDSALQLQVFADRSIVEAFGQGGRAAVTARVYPTLGVNSSKVGVYGNLAGDVSVGAWRLRRANVSREEVLKRAAAA